MTLPRSLLLAVDGSENAKAATAFTADLARTLHAQTMVATVVPEHLVVGPSWVELLSQVETAEAVELERSMDDARAISREAAAAIENGAAVEWTIEVGDPAEAIVSLADRYRAEAIVMGRRGTGNVSGLLLGSVSTKVSHLTDRTVATVRAGGDGGIGRMLVAVDGSNHSDRAAVFAAELAAASGASLTILNVVPTAAMISTLSTPPPLPDAEAAAWTNLLGPGEEIVERARRIARSNGAPDVTTLVEAGHAATVIVDYATEAGIDVICIGRRGLGNVRGLLLGSVSHEVGHLATQTVITVR